MLTKIDENFALNDNEEKNIILEEYVKKTIFHMVDEVCLYEERKEAFPSKAINCKLIPQKFDDFTQFNLVEEQIESFNELGEKNGRTGWCWVCRGGANFYCKELRLPICSIGCKRKLIEMNGIVFFFFFLVN